MFALSNKSKQNSNKITSQNGNSNVIINATKKANFAVVYQALGVNYIEEALESAKSLLKSNSEIKIYLYTDDLCPPAEDLGIITIVKEWPAGFLSKVRAVADLPEQRFVWIDTDTRISDSLASLNFFLDRYGFSAALEPLRDSRRWAPIDLGYAEDQMFPEVNSGVFAVNRALLPKDFFQCWLDAQAELGLRNPEQVSEKIADQYGLRIALGKRNVVLGILPCEFNFRACYPQVVNTMPVIIHSRTPDPMLVEARLRGINDLTMWLPFGVTLSRGGLVVRGAFWFYRQMESWWLKLWHRVSA